MDSGPLEAAHVEVLPTVGVVQYFRERSQVETTMAEQTPGQHLKSYPVYALRGIRIGLLAFVATLVVVVVKLARTGQADDVQGSPRAPDLMFVLMMAVLTANIIGASGHRQTSGEGGPDES